MSIFEALTPFPDGTGAGAVLAFFFVILVLGALALVQELLIASRAFGLLSAIRSLESERIRSARQLRELTETMAKSHPELASGMRQMESVAYEQQGVVRLASPPSEMLENVHMHRGPLPRALLQAMPSLLVGLGICGSLVGLSVGLDGAESVEAAMTVALRVTIWGVLIASLLVGMSRWSTGTVNGARDRLVSWLESQVGTASSASGLVRLSRSQDQLRKMMEQTEVAIQDLLKIQKTVLENNLAESQKSNSEELIAALTAALEAAQREPDNSAMLSRLDTIAERLAAPDNSALEGAIAGVSRGLSDISRQWSSTAARLEASASEAGRVKWPALEERMDRMITEIEGLGQPIHAAAGSLAEATEKLLAGNLESQEKSREALTTSLSRAQDALDRSAEALLSGTEGYLKANDTLSALISEHQTSQRGLVSTVDSVGRMVAQLESVTADVRDGAASMADVLGPVSDSVRTFRAASDQLAGVLPGIEGAAESYARAKDALDRSAEAMLAGTDGYLRAGDTVRELVGEVREVQSAQAASAEDWKTSLSEVSALIGNLSEIAGRAERGTAQMAAVLGPAAASIAVFKSASDQLATVMPGIEGTAERYVSAQAALDASTAALQESARGYQEAGKVVTELVATLQQVQSDQGSALAGWQSSVESMNALIGDLGGAADAVRGSVGQLSDVLPPMTTAASSFLEASQRMSVVLPGIEGAAESYERSQAALNTASDTLIRSTTGYQEAGETVRQMLGELNAAHIQSIERISAGVDEAVLSSMTAAGEQLMTFNRHQQASLTLWQTSADQIAAVMDSMKQTASHLAQVAGRIEQTTAPTLTASQAFQAAAEALSEAMPRIEDSARSNAEIRTALEQASAAIARGTDGYQEAGAAVERMVASLESQHAAALATAAAGLKSTLTDPMDAAGARLEGALTAQAALLAAWQQALSQFSPAISQLNQSTTGLSVLAGQFRDAALPASDAAKSFQDAAKRLTSLFPQLESSADGYDKVNQALAAAAAELTNAGISYSESGERMESLIKELKHTLKLQVLGTREFASAMDKATHFVDTIGPASERVERAAVGLHDAADKTTEVVRTVQNTVEIQDGAIVQMKETAGTVVQALEKQATHWSSFLGEMGRLESVLQTSVSTLGTELPHSIDHTLVHFDAALGEGVSRIGSAIERLREAMDDLNERLEGMLADNSRRR